MEQIVCIVGHTIFPDITTFNDGRIIAINVDNKENREKKLGRGILIENNKISVIGDSGMLKKQLRFVAQLYHR